MDQPSARRDLIDDDSLIDIVAAIRTAFSIPQGSIPTDPRVSAFLWEKFAIRCPGNYTLGLPSVRVGINTNLGIDFSAFGQDPVHIGRYCAFGPQVTVLTNSHETRFPNLQSSLQSAVGASNPVATTAAVQVGHNAWIGARSTILPGVRIGNGAVLGAASVVTRDVPDFAVAVGHPAKVIRMRFEQDIIDQLADLAWWNWPLERLIRNRLFFDTDMTDYTGSVSDLLVE